LSDVSLIGLAQQHARWLMDRQKVISDNVAHASAPGYRAVDVKPFSDHLDRTMLGMTATNINHLSSTESGARLFGRVPLRTSEVSHSGNSVSLDQQLMMASEVRQGYALNAGIVKSFHRLVLSAAKA